jgi:predicted ATP-grasp superfamily ATP-dependent carboligase
VIQSFVGRKIRTSPPITGESAYLELVRDPGLSLFGKQVAERIPLRGPFKIDFKQDPRDGRLLVLEVNARCTLWHYLGAANGVNLMKTGYDYLVEGRLPESHEYSTRHRWVDLRLDAKAYRALAREGRLGLAGWIASLLDGPKVHNVFSWSDPDPFLALCFGRLAQGARRVAEKVLGILRLWRSTAS